MTGQHDWVPTDTTTDQLAEAVGQGPPLWPEGSYTGVFQRHQTTASGAKGTPGIQIFFGVNEREVQVDCWITEATLAGMTGDQLAAIGWNGSYSDCEFDPPAQVPLYMKHDTYKGKTRERWNISTQAKAATPAVVQAVDRACLVWKSKRATPPPAPGGRPLPPPAAPPRAAAPAKAPAAPPKPPAPPKAPKAKPAGPGTMDEAWAVWVECKCEDGTLFYGAIERVAGHADTDKLTAAQWSEVASLAPRI